MSGTHQTPLEGRVLVVDEDYDTLDQLAEAMRRHGHKVVLATDGRSGLAHAVEMQAEVVLVDCDVRIIDVRTFVDVLTENPRTQGAHVFLIGRGDPSELSALEPRAEPIVKPFHAEEVAARVDEVVRARREPASGPDLEGELEQVGAFDLLQVFAQSRRTGLLRIESPHRSGEIFVRDGQIVAARSGAAVAEKALYRLLAVLEGQFVFIPGRLADRERIASSVDHLLMEAARRTDERLRLTAALPPLVTVLAPAANAPADLDGLPAQILGDLAEPRSLGEILDTSTALDLELLRAVEGLLSAGHVVVHQTSGRVRLCEPADEPVVRGAMMRLRRPGLEGPGRLGITGDAAAVQRFGRALAGIEDFVAAPEPPAAAGTGLFGHLGRLRLGGTELELFALPPDRALRPWWPAFVAQGRMVLALQPVEPLGSELRVATAAAGWESPAGAAETLRAAFKR
ncbi:MAG: hypothetical protein CMN30_04060 [Sandaracinus sp.]|nr:hypothetical protein [Sandaracinus sp.]